LSYYPLPSSRAATILHHRKQVVEVMWGRLLTCSRLLIGQLPATSDTVCGQRRCGGQRNIGGDGFIRGGLIQQEVIVQHGRRPDSGDREPISGTNGGELELPILSASSDTKECVAAYLRILGNQEDIGGVGRSIHHLPFHSLRSEGGRRQNPG
jgi:hypothetical protein